MKFKTFLSYTTKDRKAVVVPFLESMKERGIASWCDIHEIKWGDSIVEQIQVGLTQSSFLIAFISRDYLMRPWPMKELRTAMAQQLSGKIRVLPVLLGVGADEVSEVLPFLSEIRHLWVSDYSPNKPVQDWDLRWMLEELESARAMTGPLRIAEHFGVLELPGAVRSASFCSHYAFFSVLTDTEYAEYHRRFHESTERSPIKEHIARFIHQQGLEETADWSICWLDTSRESIIVSGDVGGNVAIWSRQTRSLARMLPISACFG